MTIPTIGVDEISEELCVSNPIPTRKGILTIDFKSQKVEVRHCNKSNNCFTERDSN